MPSIAPETFELTVVEAFACGTPAIIRSAGGNRESVDYSAAGWVSNNERELLDAIHSFERDPRLRHKLGTLAGKAYEENYSMEIHINRYLELVDSVAQQKSQIIGKSANSTYQLPGRTV